MRRPVPRLDWSGPEAIVAGRDARALLTARIEATESQSAKLYNELWRETFSDALDPDVAYTVAALVGVAYTAVSVAARAHGVDVDQAMRAIALESEVNGYGL